MKKLVSSDPENFDGPYAVLLQRMPERHAAINARLRQIESQLLNNDLSGSSEHNPSVGNRCIPLVDGYVVVFRLEEWLERGEAVRYLRLEALDVEAAKH